jgi:small subunit ribosomal protein S4e
VKKMAILKRLAAPKFWNIARRGEKKKFIISPSPGPHKKEKCIPLGIIIRDYLKLAETLKEVKKIKAKVDGKIRNYKFPIGLFDVLEIGNKFYRIVPSKNILEIKEINDGNIKPLRLEDKTYVKGNKVQLHFHDGRNILVEKDQDIYKTGDVIIFDLNQKKILDLIKFDKGMLAIIIDGKNVGKIGKIEEIIPSKSLTTKTRVKINVNGNIIETPKEYCFVIGKDSPIIEI